MKEKLQKMFWTSLISTALFIILGLFLVFQPGITIVTISYILAGLMFIMGIFAGVTFFRTKNEKKYAGLDLVYSIISILAGFLLIIHPVALATFIPIVLGIWVIISSASKLQYAFYLKTSGSKSWITTLVISIVMMIIGVIVVFNPFSGALVLTQIIGSVMIIYAVVDLVQTILIRGHVEKIMKELK